MQIPFENMSSFLSRCDLLTHVFFRRGTSSCRADLWDWNSWPLWSWSASPGKGEWLSAFSGTDHIEDSAHICPILDIWEEAVAGRRRGGICFCRAKTQRGFWIPQGEQRAWFKWSKMAFERFYK